MGECIAHCGQIGNFAVDARQMFLGDPLDVTAGAALVLVKGQERPAILDGKPERPGMAQKGQLVQVAGAKTAIAVGGALRGDKADIFIIPDGLWGQSSLLGNISDVHAGTSA
mgnify:FL=1